ADHAGFPLKGSAIDELKRLGHDVIDLGTNSEEPVDYPDFARAVGEAVMRGEADRGLLICGSGVGASVAANKIPGVRAAVCHDTFSARQGVEDDDMNVLCLGARIIGPELALEAIRAWNAATFSNAERHVRRLNKVKAIEAAYQRGKQPSAG
ncbi:MAG: ribose 5-phosphate isomerase B, partial [Dehalococcoidia bacterium]|nr:ribose 5-phosphate isomerase B [Dehalococcoidia bacterium]